MKNCLQNLLLLLAFFAFFTPIFGQIQLGASIKGEGSAQSGIAVSMSADGGRVAIGEPASLPASTGQVRVFDWVNSAWEKAGLNILGEGANNYSGLAVSLAADGQRLAVGAPGNNQNGNNAGQVRVFEWTNGAWQQLGADIDGLAANDQFGASVALSADGKRLAAGAWYHDGNGTDAGQVRVFEWKNGGWEPRGDDILGDNPSDQLGNVALSADGNVLAVGAGGNDGNGPNSGQIRIFSLKNNNWEQMGDEIDGEAGGDFACRVSLSGDGSRVAVGAIYNDGNGTDSGHARVFAWVNIAWQQLGTDIDGKATNDFFGSVVSLSSDGNRLAISAPNNDAGGLANAGQVRVFEWKNGKWAQFGVDIDGTEQGGFAGGGLSLAADGNRLAVGAFGNGFLAGETRFFDLSGISAILTVSAGHFEVFQNPATKEIDVILDENITDFQLVDILGRSIKNGRFSRSAAVRQFSVRLDHEISGIYFLTINTEKSRLTRKLLIW